MPKILVTFSLFFIFSVVAPTSSTSDPIIEKHPSQSSAENNVIDSTHPYYIHPCDYPRMNLISIVFDENSYGGWRSVVIIALSVKNKIGFTDGSLEISIGDLVLQKAWTHCNDIILSLLLNCLLKR